MRPFLLAIAALGSISLSWGHLVPGSLKFSRTGPYHPGDTVTVSFGVEVVHQGVNIDLSLDGKKWTTLKANMPAPSKQTYSYKWIVGNDTTSHGKLRICQMNGITCTNADTTDDPSGAVNGARYVLIKSPLSITAPVTALSQIQSDAAPALHEVGPGSLELTFSLSSEGPVSLIAYDATGRQAAVLLQGRFPAGWHRLSIFSEAMRTHPNWMLRMDEAGQNRVLGR